MSDEMVGPPLLQVRDLVAGWGETVVLESVSFALPEHGALAVLGRNGVGKTTLLATLMGRTRQIDGAILFRGRDLRDRPTHARSRAGIGYVPQSREIFPSLSVAENLAVAARPGAWTMERVFDLFPRLAERRRNGGTQLSGGEQQMLAIGRALMTNPSLLLLDEPMEGLAPMLVEALLAALARLRGAGGPAIVLVEQHASLALRMTEQALILRRGRVIHAGPSAALLAAPERLAELVMAL
ncbi:MAG TPA: ABC transporter ATP-binding protein [Acetobacteraceae bacterium]|nr:ABC transporter ATP-binding protein [Acetobacteraceae bacterium]